MRFSRPESQENGIEVSRFGTVAILVITAAALAHTVHSAVTRALPERGTASLRQLVDETFSPHPSYRELNETAMGGFPIDVVNAKLDALLPSAVPISMGP